VPEECVDDADELMVELAAVELVEELVVDSGIELVVELLVVELRVDELVVEAGTVEEGVVAAELEILLEDDDVVAARELDLTEVLVVGVRKQEQPLEILAAIPEH
jgi:hypothetical protein